MILQVPEYQWKQSVKCLAIPLSQVYSYPSKWPFVLFEKTQRNYDYICWCGDRRSSLLETSSLLRSMGFRPEK